MSLDKHMANHNGRERLQHSTIGWFVCCQWKDCPTLWKNVDVKEFHSLTC